MTRVWVTRAEPGATGSAEKLRALGFMVTVAPLLAVRQIDVRPIDVANIGAIAFTGSNAVRAFASQTPVRTIPAYAVGQATAEAAISAGFAVRRIGQGDVAALAQAIIGDFGGDPGAVLIPGPVEPAGDLVGALATGRIEARLLKIYETLPAELPADFHLTLPLISIVALYSPKAARGLVQVLARWPSPHLRVFCLSAAVAAPVAGTDLAQICVAALPNEASLLSLFTDLRC